METMTKTCGFLVVTNFDPYPNGCLAWYGCAPERRAPEACDIRIQGVALELAAAEEALT